LRRPRLKPLFAAATFCGVFLISTTAGSAAIATDSGVHTWMFDTANSVVKTQAAAVTVAQRNDVIVGVERYGQYLAAMKAAHPGIVIAQYHKGTTVAGPDYTWVKANHPDWLLKGKSGSVLRSSWGGYLINPELSAVRQWQATYAKAQQAAGWTGVYMDAMGSMAFYGFPSIPVDPQTGQPFTLAKWLSATSGLAGAVDAAVTIPVIDNGLNNGTRYFTNTHVLANVAQAGVFEECFRDATDPAGKWPSEADWQNQVNAIADVQSKGKIALCLTKVWSSATDALRRQWQQFTVASYLLAKGSSADYMFMGSRTQNALATTNTGYPALGAATSAKAQQGSLWVRHFQHGMVVVNPGAKSATMKLGAAFRNSSGQTVSSATLPPHTGQIFTS
jgi:uncharacterized short protein YbdD (DUF466 family)